MTEASRPLELLIAGLDQGAQFDELNCARSYTFNVTCVDTGFTPRTIPDEENVLTDDNGDPIYSLLQTVQMLDVFAHECQKKLRSVDGFHFELAELVSLARCVRVMFRVYFTFCCDTDIFGLTNGGYGFYGLEHELEGEPLEDRYYRRAQGLLLM